MSISGTIRVLHVDDEPSLADMAATFLEREDDRITVHTGTNPADGLKQVADNEFDCIVSDYDMPGRTGIEFLEAVRENYSELPFILYTGKGSEEVASDAISAGVTDYLQKESGTGQYTVLANRISNAVEQYRSRKAVQETERKLSELAERTDDVLFMFDADWSEILFVNSAYEEVWDRSSEELKENPASFLENIHPDDRKKTRASMTQLSQGESSQIECRIVRSNGEHRWVRADARPIQNEKGDVVRIVGRVRDITEQKERELHLETIIDNLPGYVYRHEYTPEYPLQFVKGDAEMITGYTTNELEEDVIRAEEIIHPDDQEKLWDEYVEGIEATGGFDTTYRIITKGGDERWIRDQGQLIQNPVTGEEVIDGFITDVSDQIQRERELSRQQTFIDESLDALQDIYYAVDSDGHLIRWNERVPEVSGYTDEELEEMDVTEFFVEEHHTRIKESLNTTFETGSSMIEADVLTGERERIPFEFRETRLTDPDSGEPIAVGVGRDISDQLRREQELEASAQYRQRIYEITSATERSPEQKIKQLLELGCEILEMENGHVTQIDRSRQRHTIRYATGSDLVTSGTIRNLSETFCRQTIETDDILDTSDTETSSVVGESFDSIEGISCYVGTKLFVDEELFGTVCFVDREPRDKPVSDSEKALIDLIGRWISQTLQSEQQRKEREAIFNRMTDAVFSVDDGWRITYANDTARAVLNTAMDASYSSEGLTGRDLWEEIPSLVGTQFEEKYREAMKTQQAVAFREYYEPLETWFDVHTYPSESGLSVYFRDVTDEQKREAKIRGRERTLREMYEVIADTTRSFDEQVRGLLDIGKDVIGVEYGSLH